MSDISRTLPNHPLHGPRKRMFQSILFKVRGTLLTRHIFSLHAIKALVDVGDSSLIHAGEKRGSDRNSKCSSQQDVPERSVWLAV